MEFEESHQPSQCILDTKVVPNEILTETQNHGHGNTGNTELFDSVTKCLNGDGGKAVDAFLAEIGYDLENFDVFKYVDPKWLVLLDVDATHLSHIADSGKEGPEATARSDHMVRVEEPQNQTENDVRKMVSGQPLVTSKLQPENEQLLQANSELQEEVIMKEAFSLLVKELDLLEASQQSPEISQEMDLQKQQQSQGILNSDDDEMLDAFVAKVGNDLETFDIYNHFDPDLDKLLNEGLAKLSHTIDSGEEGPEATASVHLARVQEPQKQAENNVRKILPEQPLKTSQVQPENEQLLKANSELQEELNHLKEAYLQLQMEIKRLEAPQQYVEIPQKMDLPNQSQVEQSSTVDTRIHEIDVVGDITTSVNNSLPLTYSGLSRTRRTRKPRQFYNESMELSDNSSNEENIVSHSETILAIQEKNQVVAPSKKRPATRNLRRIAKKRRSSQFSVEMEKNVGIKDNYHGDEKDTAKASDEDETNNNLNEKSMKKLDRCNVGGNSFSKKDKKMEHIGVKNGNRYVCYVQNCNSIFKTRRGLQYHKLAHAGSKPHSCNECTKSFRQKSNLLQHKVIHTGEKPHLCKICNKSFGRKSTLIDHLKIHTGEKPHLCHICNKSFRFKCNLTVHSKKCTGE